MRLVPETANRADWPRLVAQSVKELDRRQRDAINYAALANYADDTAAAAGGVAVGELYRTASAVKVRVS